MTLHRILFREHVRHVVVRIAHSCALIGSGLLGLALVGVNLLVFDVVVGTRAALTAGGCSLALVTTLWLLVPLALRGRASRDRAG